MNKRACFTYRRDRLTALKAAECERKYLTDVYYGGKMKLLREEGGGL